MSIVSIPNLTRIGTHSLSSICDTTLLISIRIIPKFMQEINCQALQEKVRNKEQACKLSQSFRELFRCLQLPSAINSDWELCALLAYHKRLIFKRNIQVYYLLKQKYKCLNTELTDTSNFATEREMLIDSPRFKALLWHGYECDEVESIIWYIIISYYE